MRNSVTIHKMKSALCQIQGFFYSLLSHCLLSCHFPKSCPVCLVAAFRHTLLSLHLLFDSLSRCLSLSRCPLLLSFTLSDTTTSPHPPSVHLYFFFLSSESCPRLWTRAAFTGSRRGPAPIILGIDLCCIDER